MSFQRDRNSRGLSFALKPAGTKKMYNYKPPAKEASLYITGLSDQVCEQDLDKYFQDICKVSRIKIAPKKEGTKTRVAFISLCNAGELDKAIQASNGRYIVDSKIKVCAAKEKATGGTVSHRQSCGVGGGSGGGPVVRRNDSGQQSYHGGAARFPPPASRSVASHEPPHRELHKTQPMHRGDSYYGPSSAPSTAPHHQVNNSPYQCVSRLSAGLGGTSSAHRSPYSALTQQSMSGGTARPATGGKLAAQFNKLRAMNNSATLTSDWHEQIQAFIDKKGLPRQAYNVVPTERVFEKKWHGRQPLPPAYTLIQPSDPILSITSTTGSVSTTDTLTSLTTSPAPAPIHTAASVTGIANHRRQAAALQQSHTAASGSGHSDQESGSTTDPKHHQQRSASPITTAVTPALSAYSTSAYCVTGNAYGGHSKRDMPVKRRVSDSAHTSGSGWMACGGVKRSAAAVEDRNDYYGPSSGCGQQYGRNQRAFY